MTPTMLAAVAVLPIRQALQWSRPEIDRACRAKLGLVRWWLVRPVWGIAWYAFLFGGLPIATRIGIELAVRVSGPKLVGALELLGHFPEFVERRFGVAVDPALLADLITLARTPRGDLSLPVVLITPGAPRMPEPLRLDPLGEPIPARQDAP